MPNTTTIVIKDGKATPQDHTFTPKGVSNGNGSFQDLAAPSVAGRDELLISSAEASGQQAVKVTVRLRRPFMQQLTGSNGQVSNVQKYQYLGVVEIYLPKDGSQDERKDMRVLLANALLSTAASAVIDNVEQFW